MLEYCHAVARRHAVSSISDVVGGSCMRMQPALHDVLQPAQQGFLELDVCRASGSWIFARWAGWWEMHKEYAERDKTG